MPLPFADRLNNVETSAIRELFKLLGKPGIVSFAGGFPDSAMFDVEGIREASNKALNEEPGAALQYGARRTNRMKSIQDRNQGVFRCQHIGNKKTNIHDVNLSDGAAAAAQLRELCTSIFATEIQCKSSKQNGRKPLH